MTYKITVLATPNLVGLWMLDEPSGAVAADSGPNNLPGSYVNAPTLGQAGLLTGDPATTVLLNGTNQFVSIPDNAAFDCFEGVTEWTVALLVSHTSDATERYLWHKSDTGEDIQLSSNNFGTPNMKVNRSNNAGSDQSFPSGQLVPGTHYVLQTYDGTAIRTYIDNALFDTTPSTRILPALPYALRFGAYSAAGACINGKIQAPAVWSRALTAPERLALYTASTVYTPPPPPPVVTTGGHPGRNRRGLEVPNDDDQALAMLLAAEDADVQDALTTYETALRRLM